MLTILFTPMVGYADAQLDNTDQDDADRVTQEAKEAVDEIVDELEELMEELEGQKTIVDEEKVTDNELEDAIEEVENLETLEEEEEPVGRVVRVQRIGGIGDRIEEGFGKAKKVVDIVNKQIELKYQFVTNAADTYRLANQINANMNQIKGELKDIVKNPDREFNGEDFDRIKAINKNLRDEMREIDYTVGQMTRETKTYIGYVRGRQFRDAVRTFENMVYIQGRQIETLELILYNTQLLLECLNTI